MSLEMLWVLERQDPWGKWHAVCQRGMLIAAIFKVENGAEHPLTPLLTRKNYPLFSLLSDIYAPLGQADFRGLASPGQPPDISPFARSIHGKASDIGGYHHHGHLTVQEIDTALLPGAAKPLSSAQRSVLAPWRACLGQLLWESELLNLSKILVTGSESAHERLRILQAQKSWKDPVPSQTRLLFCFDS